MDQLIFCDFEFTCNQSPTQIIQIGATKLSDDLKELGHFSAYVKPSSNIPLSSFCTQLTGIIQEDIDKADSFEVVFQRFSAWIGDLGASKLVFWGSNDAQELSREIARYKIKAPFLEAFNFQKHLEGQIQGQLGLKRASELFEVSFEGVQHDALYDAINLKNIYIKAMTAPEIISRLNLEMGLAKLVMQIDNLLEKFTSNDRGFSLPTEALHQLLKKSHLALELNYVYTIQDRIECLEIIQNQSIRIKDGLENRLLPLLYNDLALGVNITAWPMFSRKYKPFARNYKGKYTMNFSEVRYLYFETVEKHQEDSKYCYQVACEKREL